jgi:hypothetical protein
MGITPVILAFVIGSVIGIIAGYAGGLINTLIMRTIDVFYAFPSVLLAIALSGALGAGITNSLISLTIVFIPPLARVAESVTTQLRGRDFVEAARASGADALTIVRVHVLGNVLGPIFVYATSLIAVSMILASGLSFLGLGVKPPEPEDRNDGADGQMAKLREIHRVTAKGKVVYERYFGALEPAKQHSAMSVTKSFVGTLAAMLVDEGKLDEEAPVARYLPELKGSAFGDATVWNVGTQLAWLPTRNFEIGVDVLYARVEQDIRRLTGANTVAGSAGAYTNTPGVYTSSVTREKSGNWTGRLRVERTF